MHKAQSWNQKKGRSPFFDGIVNYKIGDYRAKSRDKASGLIASGPSLIYTL